MMLCNPIKNLSKIDESKYVFECKKDGIRAFVAYTKEKGVTIRNRDNLDINYRYPELNGIKLEYDALLDGEIVLEKNGRCDFSSLMSREHLKDSFKINIFSKKYPVKFYAFDILFFGGNPIYKESLLKRKAVLEGLSSNGLEVLPCLNSLKEALELYKEEEGIIIKEINSTYEFNTRSDKWLKYKKHIERLVRFYKYDVNTDRSITLTDDFHRVKCCDLIAKTKIDTYGYVDCEVTGLELTESNHIRQPVIKRVC